VTPLVVTTCVPLVARKLMTVAEALNVIVGEAVTLP
jgi:hypothetical protein